jgi:sporulation protein YlmC with PRC-barrel domain
MAYYNVSSPTTRAILQISTASIASTSSGTIVGAVQDITINNANGTFSWTQLDTQSQLTVATPATNSIAANVVVDSASFFTATTGIFDLSNNKTLVYFRVYFNGTGTGAKYISGSGYLTNLAPKVSPTAPVWVTPITISVDGDLASGTV